MFNPQITGRYQIHVYVSNFRRTVMFAVLIGDPMITCHKHLIKDRSISCRFVVHLKVIQTSCCNDSCSHFCERFAAFIKNCKRMIQSGFDDAVVDQASCEANAAFVIIPLKLIC